LDLNHFTDIIHTNLRKLNSHMRYAAFGSIREILKFSGWMYEIQSNKNRIRYNMCFLNTNIGQTLKQKTMQTVPVKMVCRFILYSFYIYNIMIS